MEEKRYLISDAAREAQVEPHVLRYWEEELNLPIQRTELGHRYYTEKDIQTFQNIKELKERGFQLKAIKVLLPELKNHSAKSTDNIISLEQKMNEYAAKAQQAPPEKREFILSEDAQKKEAEPSKSDKSERSQTAVEKEGSIQSKEAAEESTVTFLPMNANLDRIQQFEGIMTNLFRQTLKDNNDELETRISDAVLKGMDMLMQLREEKEEERFRRLDETIRFHQKKGKTVAAAKEPGSFRLFRRRRG